MPVKKAESDIAADAKRALDARAPARAERDAKLAAESEKWNKEIAALESRIINEVSEVDLGNGTTIAIRMCLKGSEIERLDYLEETQKVATDPHERALMACEIIAIITANPLITTEWLMDNQDKYSPADVALVLLGFMEVRLKERKEHFLRLKSAMDFRPIFGGN